MMTKINNYDGKDCIFMDEVIITALRFLSVSKRRKMGIKIVFIQTKSLFLENISINFWTNSSSF